MLNWEDSQGRKIKEQEEQEYEERDGKRNNKNVWKKRLVQYIKINNFTLNLTCKSVLLDLLQF